MPDAKQMSGIPRPVTDLPEGHVSVRLIRGQLSNNIPGHPVEMHAGSKVITVKTDEPKTGKRPAARGPQTVFFSPDAKTLAWSLDGTSVSFWDVATGRRTGALTVPTDATTLCGPSG